MTRARGWRAARPRRASSPPSGAADRPVRSCRRAPTRARRAPVRLGRRRRCGGTEAERVFDCCVADRPASCGRRELSHLAETDHDNAVRSCRRRRRGRARCATRRSGSTGSGRAPDGRSVARPAAGRRTPRRRRTECRRSDRRRQVAGVLETGVTHRELEGRRRRPRRRGGVPSQLLVASSTYCCGEVVRCCRLGSRPQATGAVAGPDRSSDGGSRSSPDTQSGVARAAPGDGAADRWAAVSVAPTRSSSETAATTVASLTSRRGRPWSTRPW